MWMRRRIPWMVGVVLFMVVFVVGWIVTRNSSGPLGVAEVVGVFHAALGIGFASGFLSYVLLSALSTPGRP